jgi:hypothetical protein
MTKNTVVLSFVEIKEYDRHHPESVLVEGKTE